MNERHGYAAESAVFCAVMQWLIIALTLIVWALLKRAAHGAATPLEATATLGLGLLALLAYLAGALARRLRLPRLTGYLLAGFVAGPAWFGLLSADDVRALAPIANGALALIALAAGNALSLDMLRPGRRESLRVAVGAMALPFALVFLVVLTVSPWFPLTAHQPLRDALAIALALAALAAVGSPTFTWTLLRDRAASGAVSEAVLDTTALQAILAVLLVIVVLALAGPLATRGAVMPGTAVHTLLVLAGSLLAGAALGLAAGQYLRAIDSHLVWLLLGFAFVASQAARLGGLDPVLLGLVAGATLRNTAPPAGARLGGELERCAPPVYVVFFALAGSGLQFDVLADLWPWALLLAGLRATGLWASLRWDWPWHKGKPPAPALARFGWLGFVSQGWLAITLAALLRRAFPGSNVSLEALLVAMVGVHELLGPVCFQWALRRSGELREEARTHAPETPDTSFAAAVAVGGSGDGM
jgi:Kef-type K+ transport system membrane component KefB